MGQAHLVGEVIVVVGLEYLSATGNYDRQLGKLVADYLEHWSKSLGVDNLLQRASEQAADHN